MTEMISHPNLESRGQGRSWGQVSKAISLAGEGLGPGHHLDRDSTPSPGMQRGQWGNPHRSMDFGYWLNSRNAGAIVQAVGEAGSAGVRKGNAVVRSQRSTWGSGQDGQVDSPLNLRTSFLRKWLGTQYFSASLRTQ